jgi:hypothetical protein
LLDHRLALGSHLSRLGGQDVGHRACLAEFFRQSLAIAARQRRRVILRGHPDIQAQRDRIGDTQSLNLVLLAFRLGACGKCRTGLS